MEYPADEAAKWAEKVDGLTRKLRGTVQGLLTDAAARGFETVPGPTMGLIVEATVDTKVALTQANQTLYKDGLQRIDKEVETGQKVAFGLAKLDYEAYKADLENELELQKAWGDMMLAERRAYIERLKSDVDKRQAAIIEERALIEHEINYWKKLAIEAEGLALDAEVELANEKVKTAEEKMKIVEWLYKVIEAGQLIIAAEYKKAAALEKLIIKEEELIEVKEAMIPLQKQKASARIKQADAITEEAEWKKEIEELGYRRIELTAAKEEAEHEIRLAEEDYEEARIAYTKADRQTELTRQQAKTTIMEYENVIRGNIITRRAALDKVERSFRHDFQHYWKKYELTGDFRYMDLGKKYYVKEAIDKMLTIQDVAKAKAKDAAAGGTKTIVKTSGSHMDQYVSKGS